jgi:formyltetrahydrofolate synthetase
VSSWCCFCTLPSLQAKIEAIACGTYGAASVSYSAEAEAVIAEFTVMGFDKPPLSTSAEMHCPLPHPPRDANLRLTCSNAPAS